MLLLVLLYLILNKTGELSHRLFSHLIFVVGGIDLFIGGAIVYIVNIDIVSILLGVIIFCNYIILCWRDIILIDLSISLLALMCGDIVTRLLVCLSCLERHWRQWVH